MAHDDDDGNDEFENNFDTKELLVMLEKLEYPITENEVVKSVKIKVQQVTWTRYTDK